MLLPNFVCRYRVLVMGSSSTPTSHHHPLFHLFRFLSSISNSDSNSSFTVDYLINSCGLSPESALKASKGIQLKSPTNPDSVLSLFKTFDISKPHISKLISVRPSVLLADPHKTLKPKLEFLSSIGMSGPIIGEFLSGKRNCLMSSLENQIIPAIKFFKSLVHTDSNVLKILNRFKWTVHEVECKMAPNIAILRNHGVPDTNISKFIVAHPQSFYVKPDQFKKAVLELETMGVSLSDNMFLHCLYVRLLVKKPKWDAKMGVYMSLGWSENEVLSLFKRQPFIMAISEKKIKLGLNFVTDKLDWTRADIDRYPTVIMLSLEKRLIPRNFVLQTLLSKGLINRTSIGGGLIVTEDMFLKKFVIKYCHKIPNLLKLYQSKMSTQNSLIGSAGDCASDRV